MTNQDLLTSYRMTVLLPPPEGIYKNDRALTKEQMDEFLKIDNIEEAHAFYMKHSEENMLENFREFSESL